MSRDRIDVTVEDAAHLVGDRLFHVAARDQHGVKRGDRSARVRPGPFEQPGQQREHAGRIALPRGRLAGRQPDLTLGARDARDRIEHEQHALALVAKVFGDRGGDERGLQPDQAGRVAGRAHDDRARAARRAQRLLEEVDHLAAALADQRDDVHVRLGLARDLSHQRRLADARAGEDADALALADGQQAVEDAHAQRQRLADARARQRIGRGAIDGPFARLGDRAGAVDGLAEPVEHAPEQMVRHADRERTARRRHQRIGADARRLAQRHQHDLVAAEADHLGASGGGRIAGRPRWRRPTRC